MSTAKRILVAGIGNIFLGDDAFGSEVARELSRETLPDGVRVVDFGIRSYDLAYAIMENYDATILVDATPRGEPPGTVSLIEPDLSELDGLETSEEVDAHSMNPVRVLQLVRSLGGKPDCGLYLVGCEPAVLETDALGLSEPVQAAIPQAVAMIQSLVRDLLHGNPIAKENSGPRPSREEVNRE